MKATTSQGQNPLRYYAKTRILNDMIGTAKKRALYDREYLILVMDSSALKVFSSCCKMFEVFGAGLYHIERLEKKRKKYPKTDAIYFISPNKLSIQRLLDDFPPSKEDTESGGGMVGKLGLDTPLMSKPDTRKHQYGALHLFFSSRLSEEMMTLLMSGGKNIVPLIQTLSEVNLDFYFFNDNVFHLGRSGMLPVFKMMCEGGGGGLDTSHISRKGDIGKNQIIDILVTEMANRLFTVCAIFPEYPYV